MALLEGSRLQLTGVASNALPRRISASKASRPAGRRARIQGAAAIGLLEPHFVAKEVDKLIFRRTLGS
jgi:hypothetical protein